MFNNDFSVEIAFSLIFQSLYLCYTYELSIMDLISHVLTLPISQQNIHVLLK